MIWPGPGAVHEPARPNHDFIEGIAAGQTGEHDVRALADIGGRRRRSAADLFELGRRTAPKAHHLITGREQMFADLGSDAPDPDEADRLHALPPFSSWRHYNFTVDATAGTPPQFLR